MGSTTHSNLVGIGANSTQRSPQMCPYTISVAHMKDQDKRACHCHRFVMFFFKATQYRNKTIHKKKNTNTIDLTVGKLEHRYN